MTAAAPVRPVRRAGWALAMALLLAACGGKNSPEGLRSGVEAAIRNGDLPALRALVDMSGAPAMQVFLLANLLPGCAEDAAGCKVELQPLDEKWQTEFKARVAAQEMEVPHAPEGLLVITKATEGSKMTVRLPFAQVDGQFKVVSGRMAAAKLATLAATDARKAATDALAGGVPVPESSDKDTGWQATATELPAGGGDAGAAWLANIEQRNAAIAAQDADALAKVTGEWGKVVFAANDYAGKPVPPQVRKLKVAAQSVRFVASAQVLGGWGTADRAVLIVDGKDHSGNLRRGAVFMQKTAEGWSEYADELVEIPQG